MRERDKEREKETVCVCVCVCERERERERETVCEREIQRDREREKERERERERESACASVYIYTHSHTKERICSAVGGLVDDSSTSPPTVFGMRLRITIQPIPEKTRLRMLVEILDGSKSSMVKVNVSFQMSCLKGDMQ